MIEQYIRYIAGMCWTYIHVSWSFVAGDLWVSAASCSPATLQLFFCWSQCALLLFSFHPFLCPLLYVKVISSVNLSSVFPYSRHHEFQHVQWLSPEMDVIQGNYFQSVSKLLWGDSLLAMQIPGLHPNREPALIRSSPRVGTPTSQNSASKDWARLLVELFLFTQWWWWWSRVTITGPLFLPFTLSPLSPCFPAPILTTWMLQDQGKCPGILPHSKCPTWQFSLLGAKSLVSNTFKDLRPIFPSGFGRTEEEHSDRESKDTPPVEPLVTLTSKIRGKNNSHLCPSEANRKSFWWLSG